jgi:uncharacterized protein YkwD
MVVSIYNLSQDQINDVTEYINTYRRKHHSHDMTYNSEISKVAQDWSKYLINNNIFKHSYNKKYGENLSLFRGYKNDIINLIKKSIDLWYQEVKYYDFNKSEYNSQSGHFTALVWNDSYEFGIGYTYNSINKTAVIVMNMYIQGNIIGLFRENVYPI